MGAKFVFACRLFVANTTTVPNRDDVFDTKKTLSTDNHSQ